MIEAYGIVAFKLQQPSIGQGAPILSFECIPLADSGCDHEISATLVLSGNLATFSDADCLQVIDRKPKGGHAIQDKLFFAAKRPLTDIASVPHRLLNPERWPVVFCGVNASWFSRPYFCFGSPVRFGDFCPVNGTKVLALCSHLSIHAKRALLIAILAPFDRLYDLVPTHFLFVVIAGEKGQLKCRRMPLRTWKRSYVNGPNRTFIV